VQTFIDDKDMDGQVVRTLAGAYSGSADLGEALAAVSRIVPGDYGSWWAEWSALAESTERAADAALAGGHRASAARGFLRATEYWRQAWFFLRHDLGDERLQKGWRRHREAFRRALPLLPYAWDAVRVPFEGATMEGYLIRPDASGKARPTVIAPCGYDSTAEAGWSATGYMALARDYNFFVVEGPGQGGMLYEHRVPMRADFEVPFAAMVDDLVRRPGVDPARVALMGRSFGGYLAPRAASADARVAALVCDPGQVELASRMTKAFGADFVEKVMQRDASVEPRLRAMLEGPRATEYWGARMATHGVADMGDFLRAVPAFTNEAMIPAIRCPTLLTEGEGDFASQSDMLKGLLRCPTTFVRFPAASGAGGHCEGLGATLFEQAAFDWLDEVLGRA
jgi:dienelactone hydrolase